MNTNMTGFGYKCEIWASYLGQKSGLCITRITASRGLIEQKQAKALCWVYIYIIFKRLGNVYIGGG